MPVPVNAHACTHTTPIRTHYARAQLYQMCALVRCCIQQERDQRWTMYLFRIPAERFLTSATLWRCDELCYHNSFDYLPEDFFSIFYAHYESSVGDKSNSGRSRWAYVRCRSWQSHFWACTLSTRARTSNKFRAYSECPRLRAYFSIQTTTRSSFGQKSTASAL